MPSNEAFNNHSIIGRVSLWKEEIIRLLLQLSFPGLLLLQNLIWLFYIFDSRVSDKYLMHANGTKETKLRCIKKILIRLMKNYCTESRKRLSPRYFKNEYQPAECICLLTLLHNTTAVVAFDESSSRIDLGRLH